MKCTKINIKEGLIQVEMEHPTDLDQVASSLKLPVIDRGNTLYVFQSGLIYFCKK